MSTETIIRNLINNDVFVCASVMVRDLSEGLTLNNASFAELYHECLIGDDYETPVRDDFPAPDSVELSDLADFVGFEYEAAFPDQSALLTYIEEDDLWQEAADILGLEPHTIEALEHWLVSDQLARDLQDVGALVAIDVLGFNIWGRTESGQSLFFDSDIRKVADATTEGIKAS